MRELCCIFFLVRVFFVICYNYVLCNRFIEMLEKSFDYYNIKVKKENNNEFCILFINNFEIF